MVEVVDVAGLPENELKKSSMSTSPAPAVVVAGIGTTGGLYSSSFDGVASFLFFDEENENHEEDFAVASFPPLAPPVAVVDVAPLLASGTSAMISRGFPMGIGGGTEGGTGGGTGGGTAGVISGTKPPVIPMGTGGTGGNGGGTGGGAVVGTGGAAPGGNGGGADFGGGGGASVNRVKLPAEVTSGL